MPTVKEILDSERLKERNYVLPFEEALFLKAYEESAYILHHRYGFKPTVKFVKTVGQMVVSVGFPKSALKNYFPNAEQNFSVLKIEMDNMVGECDVKMWKARLEEDCNMKLSVRETESKMSQLTDLHRELLSFPLENSTPHAVYDLLVRIKTKNPCRRKMTTFPCSNFAMTLCTW